MSVLVHIKKVLKMDFPLYFHKVIWWGGQNFACQIFFLKKPSTLEYAHVLVVKWEKPNSVTALLSSHPNSGFSI